MNVAIAGGSGFVGGELLRLLLGHSKFRVAQVTSEREAGAPVDSVHPNLRGADLKFVPIAALEPCDVLFLALPNGVGIGHIDRFLRLGARVIDLSGDFRLSDPAAHACAYGAPHPRPDLLGKFVRGLPELTRDHLRGASWVAVPGCMATAAMLALAPLFAAGLLERRVIIDAKMGSSGSGARDRDAGSHHAERHGVMRSLKPLGHRHTWEIAEVLARYDAEVHVSATAVGSVRGVLVTAHAFLEPRGVRTADLWRVYRGAYGHEPFVRLVARRQGLHRLPEPSVLSGSNYCDIGFVVDEDSRRVVVLAALDNLVKGAAGNAVQCANILAGFPEGLGLQALGLRPV